MVGERCELLFHTWYLFGLRFQYLNKLMFKKSTVFLMKPISVNCEKSFDPFKKKKKLD